MEATGKSTPSMGRMMAIGIVVSALVGAGAGFAGGYLAQPAAPPAQARAFYVFTSILPFNETIVGLPPDIFVPDRIVVNKGDSVTIRFYNTEDVSELHSFTMDAPYAVNQVIDMAQNVTISFTASTAGFFQWRCVYHTPTMVGILVVLG